MEPEGSLPTSQGPAICRLYLCNIKLDHIGIKSTGNGSLKQLINEINSMKQNPPWEANSHSASPEIPRLLWKPKVNYRVHKNPPLVPTLS
jgi:hypothetical protein